MLEDDLSSVAAGPVTSRRSVDGGHEISIVAARGWAVEDSGGQWRTVEDRTTVGPSEIMEDTVQEP